MPTENCQNVSGNFSNEMAYEYNTLHIYYFSLLLPLFLGVGIISNCTFLYVVYHVKFLHNATGCYLANLAIADILFLIAAVIPKILNYTGSPFYPDDTPIGIMGCITSYVSSNTAYFASLVFITYVARERFRAVCHPHQSIKWRNTTVPVTITWVLCFAFSLSFIPAFSRLKQYCLVWPKTKQYSDWPSMQSLCRPISPIAASYAEGAQTAPFFICFIINVTLYCCVIKGLRNVSSKLKKRSERERFRIQVTRMLLINSVIFFLLLSPFEFVSLSRSIKNSIMRYPYVLEADIANTVTHVTRALSYMNSIINPIIYTAFSSRFREAFALAFCQKLS